jgi:type III pantothenate kinase
MPDSPNARQTGWLVLDIGNSATKGAVIQGETLTHPFQVPDAPPDDWQEMLQTKLSEAPSFSRTGVASVVPALARRVPQAVHAFSDAEPLMVRPTLRLPFTIGYDTPETLGTDRLALAVGAWSRYGETAQPARSVVAIDAGTALTYEVITAQGTYLGGAIAPGPRLMAGALHLGTAQLPDVSLTPPGSPVGRSTEAALQSGILFGFLDGVKGMLDRLRSTLDAPPVVVVTGGWAGLLQAHVSGVDDTDPHLVLHGIQTLMRLNP